MLIREIIEKQAAAVAKNLDLVLRGKQPVAYKSDGDRAFPLPHFSFPFLSKRILTRPQQCSPSRSAAAEAQVASET
jgi:hypothetical protein